MLITLWFVGSYWYKCKVWAPNTRLPMEARRFSFTEIINQNPKRICNHPAFVFAFVTTPVTVSSVSFITQLKYSYRYDVSQAFCVCNLHFNIFAFLSLSVIVNPFVRMWNHKSKRLLPRNTLVFYELVMIHFSVSFANGFIENTYHQYAAM